MVNKRLNQEELVELLISKVVMSDDVDGRLIVMKVLHDSWCNGFADAELMFDRMLEARDGS